MREALFCYLGAVNLLALLLCGWDKRSACKGRWRVAERTLFAAAFAGGALGLYCGMLLFHHKTRHKAFAWGVPPLLLCQAVLAFWAFRQLP